MSFHDKNLFEETMALRCELKAQHKKVEEYESGERYLKIQEDHRKVINGYRNELKKVRKELAAAHAQVITNRNMWMEDNEALWDECHRKVMEKEDEILRLEDRLWKERIENEQKITRMQLRHDEEMHEKDCIIEELKKKLAHAEALLYKHRV